MKRSRKQQVGIAWIPIILWALLGSGAVIGGSVAYSDYSTRAEASENTQSEDARQILRDELNQFFNAYRRNCFSLVTSIGNRQRFQQALDDVILAFSANRTEGRLAEYEAGAVFTDQPVTQYDLTDPSTRERIQVTIWHELIHVIEVDNGDRLNWHNVIDPRRSVVTARNERHTEYAETMIGILNDFIRLESRVRSGAADAENARQTLDILRRRYGEGSDNAFEAVPSDLTSFELYSGFHVDIEEIIDLYKKRTCIKFPEGTFDDEDEEVVAQDEESANVNNNTPQSSEGKYVVWNGVNASVGINITTQKVYESQELAKSYSGGGLDPKKILEKQLLSEANAFNSFDEGESWICQQLTDVKFAPLGVGWIGDLGGERMLLGNTSCEGYRE